MDIQIPTIKGNQQALVIAAKETDEAFVLALRSGCQQTLMRLYKLYAPALKGIIIGIVKSDALAERVLMEIFVKIRYSIAHYKRSKGRLFTWMAMIARNAAVDQLNVNAVMKFDKKDAMKVICLKVAANSPASNSVFVSPVNLVSSCEKDVFELVYVEGYSMLQAAEALGITLESAKKQFRTAIQTLKMNFQVVIMA